ncbi:hypothetical protein EIP91_008682 [Steccherinum ochraceum]|uniref:Fe2OG dioxygenase domain-containing protein n=1 Tax=Steccherinum ochraceum TaxID=92696 RepID=A0A4R0R4U4_9APHY|nr:hypothetical protein EIP91_008682 [Steccherinum ochraceum]
MALRSQSPEQPKEIPFRTQFDLLQSSLPNRPPFCSGTLPTTAENLLLFYGKDPDASRFLNFAQASANQVAHFAQTCDVASFGLNQQDVIDASYRKAGKLDSAHFAAKFQLEKSGLLKIARDALLEGDQAELPIIAEPYKLNVYGPDSFFKPHKDTPRGKNMFGSLVLIYPTSHSGGSLVFRDNGEEWTFDSAAAVQVSNTDTPSIAYAAFFADVEHEVLPVQSGYRVTLTYNLYFDNEDSVPSGGGPANTPLTYTHAQPKHAFESILADPTFLPSGGLLGFGLRRQYSFIAYDPWECNQFPLRGIALKGTDALLMQTCQELGLNASLKCLYMQDTYYDIDGVLVDMPYTEFGTIDEDFLYNLYEIDKRSIRIESVVVPNAHGPPKTKRRQVDCDGEPLEDLPGRPRRTVYWITEPTEYSQVKTDYVAYGNEASTAFAYGDLCLIVDVGPPPRPRRINVCSVNHM